MPFTLLQDVAAGAVAAALSPTMDIVALATPDNAIAVVRWMAWQRVTTVASGLRDRIVSLAWAPDGRYLAASSASGELAILHLDTEVVAVVAPPITTHDDDAGLPPAVPMCWNYMTHVRPVVGGGEEAPCRLVLTDAALIAEGLTPPAVAVGALHTPTAYPLPRLPYGGWWSRPVATVAPLLSRLTGAAGVATARGANDAFADVAATRLLASMASVLPPETLPPVTPSLLAQPVERCGDTAYGANGPVLAPTGTAQDALVAATRARAAALTPPPLPATTLAMHDDELRLSRIVAGPAAAATAVMAAAALLPLSGASGDVTSAAGRAAAIAAAAPAWAGGSALGTISEPAALQHALPMVATVLTRGLQACTSDAASVGRQALAQHLAYGSVPVTSAALALTVRPSAPIAAAAASEAAASEAAIAALAEAALAGVVHVPDLPRGGDHEACSAFTTAAAAAAAAVGSSGSPSPPCDTTVVAVSSAPSLRSSVFATAAELAVQGSPRASAADARRAAVLGMVAAAQGAAGGSECVVCPFAALRIVALNSEPLAAALPQLNIAWLHLSVLDACVKHVTRAARYLAAEWSRSHALFRDALQPLLALLAAASAVGVAAPAASSGGVAMDPTAAVSALWPHSPYPSAVAELYSVLTVGAATPVMRDWLDSKLGDAALAKLAAALNAVIATVESVCVTRLLRSCELVLAVLDCCSSSSGGLGDDSGKELVRGSGIDEALRAWLTAGSGSSAPPPPAALSVNRYYALIAAAAGGSHGGVGTLPPDDCAALGEEVAHAMALVAVIRAGAAAAKATWAAMTSWWRCLLAHMQATEEDERRRQQQVAGAESAGRAGADAVPPPAARAAPPTTPQPLSADAKLVAAALAPVDVTVSCAASPGPSVSVASEEAGVGGAASAVADDPFGLGLGLDLGSALDAVLGEVEMGATTASAAHTSPSAPPTPPPRSPLRHDTFLPFSLAQVIGWLPADAAAAALLPWATYGADAVGDAVVQSWQALLVEQGVEAAAGAGAAGGSPLRCPTLALQSLAMSMRLRRIAAHTRKLALPPAASYASPPIQIDVPLTLFMPQPRPHAAPIIDAALIAACDAAVREGRHRLSAISQCACAWYDDDPLWRPPAPPHPSVVIKRSGAATAAASVLSSPVAGAGAGAGASSIVDTYDPLLWATGSHVVVMPLPHRVAVAVLPCEVGGDAVLVLRVAGSSIEPGCTRMWWKRVATAAIALPAGVHALACCPYTAVAGAMEAAEALAVGSGATSKLRVAPPQVAGNDCRSQLVILLAVRAGSCAVAEGWGVGVHVVLVDLRGDADGEWRGDAAALPWATMPPAPPDGRMEAGPASLAATRAAAIASVRHRRRLLPADVATQLFGAWLNTASDGSDGLVTASRIAAACDGVRLCASAARGVVSIVVGESRILTLDMADDGDDDDGGEADEAGAGGEDGAGADAAAGASSAMHLVGDDTL